jgi:hypothetical protein
MLESQTILSNNEFYLVLEYLTLIFMLYKFIIYTNEHKIPRNCKVL